MATLFGCIDLGIRTYDAEIRHALALCGLTGVETCPSRRSRGNTQVHPTCVCVVFFIFGAGKYNEPFTAAIGLILSRLTSRSPLLVNYSLKEHIILPNGRLADPFGWSVSSLHVPRHPSCVCRSWVADWFCGHAMFVCRACLWSLVNHLNVWRLLYVVRANKHCREASFGLAHFLPAHVLGLSTQDTVALFLL
ncbi:hypothetical protein TCAP_05486, partial [Tolypocladium capitatum]